MDILIANGTLIDGSGAPGRPADVGIEGGRIKLLPASSGATASRVIDASGQVVAPGFIDIHSHTDFWPTVDPFATSKLLDGVTCEVSGNCGFSAFPMDPETRHRELSLIEPFGGRIDWDDFASYKRSIEGSGTGPHRVMLVGHGNLRKFVMGHDDRPPSPAEMSRMKGILGDLLDQGAVGFTTGLIYPPGCFAKTEEVVELARVAQVRGKLYASHIRGEGNNLLPAMDEVLTVARRAGVRTQISHLKASGPKNWFKIDSVLESIAAARAEGFDIHADRYPYTATNTSLDTCLREWAHEGGPAARMGRLRDPALRQRLAAELVADHPVDHFEKVQTSSIPHPGGKGLEGRTVADIARERGIEPCEAVLWLLETCECEVGAIFHTLNDQIMRRVLSLDYCMVASDATSQVSRPPLFEAFPHPRSYGTFSRVLGPLCRDEGLFDLPTAVAKMTSMPARQLGLDERGRIVDGWHADLVVFDPARINDRSTFSDPHQTSVGIQFVIVAGQVAAEGGAVTGARPGSVLAV